MIRLPDREPDARNRAMDLFAAAAELALEQLDRADTAIDAGANGWHQLAVDVQDALDVLRFFRGILVATSGRSAPPALVSALRPLAPCRLPGATAKHEAKHAEEWPAQLAAWWVRRTLDALGRMDDASAAAAFIALDALAENIEMEILPARIAGHEEAAAAIADYLDSDPDNDDEHHTEPAEVLPVPAPSAIVPAEAGMDAPAPIVAPDSAAEPHARRGREFL